MTASYIPERRHLGRYRGQVIPVALYLLAYISMAYIYSTYSVYKWGYMGLVLNPNNIKIIFGLIVYIYFALITPTRWSVRSFYLNIILTAYLLPSSILFGFSNEPTKTMVLIWISIALVYLVSSLKMPEFKVPRVQIAPLMTVIAASSVALMATLVYFGGLSSFNLDLARVYDVRSDAAENFPTIFSYVIPAFTKAAIPFAIAASLHYRSRTMAIVFVTISAFMFGITSHKIMLFAPVLVFAIYLMSEKFSSYSYVLAGFVFTLLSLIVAILLTDYISVTSFWGWLESLLIWRSLIVPTLLDFKFIEFFSSADQYFWSTSTLTFGFLTPPHGGLAPASLIGLHYFGSANAEANTGFIGSGFAQAGAVGTLLYAVGAGAMISFFDSCSRRLSIPFTIGASLTLFVTMIMSTDFVGLFLTHGLLPLIIMLLVIDTRSTAPAVKSPIAA